MAMVKLKDVELYYEEFGSGDRYILQGQQFVNSHISYMKELCDHYGFHGYIIRIRGYRPSTLIKEDLGDAWYDVWAQDICDFADAMGIRRFFYTGHSHGSGIGWHLCVNHPERVAGFFASGCGPHKKDGLETGAARMATIRAAADPATWASFAEKKAAGSTEYFESLLENPELAEEAAAAIRQTRDFWVNMDRESAVMNPKKPFPRCRTEEELIQVLHTIQVPLLMLGCSGDTISTPETVVRSLHAVKDSKLVLYEGLTHSMVHFVKRKEYAAEIVNFCKERGLLTLK